ncbi:MAG: hypothetical protein GY715_00260 [Planctomycetes bacterium]|nr:hypothetical protein [Planctomycetota bacterium]
MSGTVPRAVIVRRSSDYELLLARHATRGQAKFFLDARGEDIDAVEGEHETLRAVGVSVRGRIPPRWRRAEVHRDDLDRFLFEPDDVVVAIGQDGLVANLAKYLDGQLVIGVNPLPERYDGVLVRIAPAQVPDVLRGLDEHRTPSVESRTMVRAGLDDTQSLLALNEVFVGHRTHQSARYRIRWRDREERQSSSGVIVSTGTGSTGWARSVNLARGEVLELPAPTDRRLAFFVREAFPSVATGTSLTMGCCEGDDDVRIVSEMNHGGVVFGDGIEDDFLAFEWGQTLTVVIADRTLNLVIG